MQITTNIAIFGIASMSFYMLFKKKESYATLFCEWCFESAVQTYSSSNSAAHDDSALEDYDQRQTTD
jgi:hypothetical protein